MLFVYKLIFFLSGLCSAMSLPTQGHQRAARHLHLILQTIGIVMIGLQEASQALYANS